MKIQRYTKHVLYRSTRIISTVAIFSVLAACSQGQESVEPDATEESAAPTTASSSISSAQLAASDSTVSLIQAQAAAVAQSAGESIETSANLPGLGAAQEAANPTDIETPAPVTTPTVTPVATVNASVQQPIAVTEPDTVSDRDETVAATDQVDTVATEQNSATSTGATSTTATSTVNESETDSDAGDSTQQVEAEVDNIEADVESDSDTDSEGEVEPSNEQEASSEEGAESESESESDTDTDIDTDADDSDEREESDNENSDDESNSDAVDADDTDASDENESFTDLDADSDSDEAGSSDEVDVDQAVPESSSDEDDDNEPVQREFISSTTRGFEGTLLDDGDIEIVWEADPNARGYNISRQAEYLTTVFEPRFIDTDTFDENYYYEITSFDHDDRFTKLATGLTVKVRGTGRINPDAPLPNENILDGYELVFSDEFDGGSLDSSKWVTQYLWGNDIIINSEEQYYVDILNQPDFGYNPFVFDGENLIINAIETPDELKDKARGQDYLSGVMTTRETFRFTYGYVEARAQVPIGKGLWPAFWLLTAFYDQDKPEIDIMEFIGDNQDTVYHTYHYFDSDGILRSTESVPTVAIDFPAEFHTFGVEWLPGVIIYYVDGIERHRVVDSKVSKEDMYIIFNTAIGGWWPGSPDENTQFPAEYKIDYVRAYQRRGVLQEDPTAGQPSRVPLHDDVFRAAPVHLPPFVDFPQGYPELQQ